MALFEGAASAAANQAASQVAQDSIFSSIFNPATIQSTDSIMQGALAPSLAELGTEELSMDALLSQAGLGINQFPTLEQTTGTIFSGAQAPQQQGIMGQVSDFFGNKGNTNMIDTLFKGYGAYDTYQARQDAKDFQNKQLAMSQNAYDRNVEADEKRQSLNF